MAQYNTSATTVVEISVLLVVAGVIMIIYLVSIVRDGIKKKRHKLDKEQAIKEISSRGLATIWAGKYISGLPKVTGFTEDMLISITNDALVFYPCKANTAEVARIPLSSVKEISVEDKSKDSLIFASGFIIFSSRYKKYHVAIRFAGGNSLEERAMFQFRGSNSKQVATEVVEKLMVYVRSVSPNF